MRLFTAFLLASTLLLLSAGTALAQTVTFTAGSPTIDIGTNGLVDVDVSGFTDVIGFQFTFQWDPAVYDFQSITGLNLANLDAGDFNTSQAANGIITVLWDDPTVTGVTVPDATTIFQVELQPTNEVCVGASSAMQFTNSPTDILVVVLVGGTPTAGTFVPVDGTATVGGNNPVPGLTGINPADGTLGETLDVTYTGTFQSCTTVTFSDPNITVNDVTVGKQALATTLTANVTIGGDATAGAGTTAATNPAPGGGDSGTQGFTVQYPAPDITAVNPPSAQTGETLDVTLTGTDFVDDGANSSVVTFSSADITVNTTTLNSCTGKLCTEIVVNITVDPAATTGSGTVTVTNPGPFGGGGADNEAFAIGNPIPMIDDVAPATGARGATGLVLTLTGSGFVDGVTSVTIDAATGITVNSTTVNSSTEIELDVDIAPDADLTARDVTVTNPPPVGGTDTLVDGFSVVNPAPDLTAVNPGLGDQGQTLDVTLTGTDFVTDGANSTTVDFGADITVNSTTFNSCTGTPGLCTEIVANISIGAAAATGPRDVSVTTPAPGGGTDTEVGAFAINAPPDAVDDPNNETDIGVGINIDVLDNDGDADGDPLEIIDVQSPTTGGGTAAIVGVAPNQTVDYDPAPGFSGTDTFTYEITDNVGTTTDVATVTVFVDAPPTAVDDNLTAFVNMPATLNVLGNDLSPDGDPLEVIDVQSPTTQGGITTIVSGGLAVSYSPPTGFIGTDTFTYEIDDGRGNTDMATVVVTVIGDRPPIARDDRARTNEDTPVLIDVLQNDSDPDLDLFSLTDINSPPSNGTAVIVDSVVQYTPNPGFSGQDGFNYEITDEDGLTATARVTVNVNPRDNAAPVAEDDTATTEENTAVEIDVLANDSDPDGDPITLDEVITPPTNGTAEIAGGKVTYTPGADFVGTDTFEYLISDDRGGDDAATVTVTVTEEPPPPVETFVFGATLSGAGQVPANASNSAGTSAAKRLGTGAVTATLVDNTLTVSGSFSGLVSDFNPAIGGGAHIHRGLTGQNGPVVFALTTTLGADGRSGTFEAANNTFTLTSDQVADLQARRYYVNIHTVALPAGEIRGQLVPAGDEVDATFRVVLSGRAQVPANTSAGIGGAVVEVRDDEIVLTGAFSGLESPFNPAIAGGAHIHEADIGANGGVLVPLNATVAADGLSGTFEAADNTFTVDAAFMEALDDGELYVNIHTEDLPPGEIRGQILPESYRVFEFTLAGTNEVDPVASGGTGGGLVVYDGVGIRVAGNFTGLESDFATEIGAHLHGAGAGENGGVIFPLVVTLDADNRGGSFAADDNEFAVTPDQEARLFDAGFYANIHTADNPGGELRGQVLVSTNVAPAAVAITDPPDGTEFNVMGDPETVVAQVLWEEGSDPNGNPIAFRFEAALDPGFSTIVIARAYPEGTIGVEIDAEEAAELMDALGVGLGESITLYARAVATDGSIGTPGPGISAILTRGTITAIEGSDEVPGTFAVHGNYPNPFNPSTSIQVDLPRAAAVSVEIYDLLGRQILVTPLEQLPAGTGHILQVDAARLSSGTYVYRVVARAQEDVFVGSGRMVLIK